MSSGRFITLEGGEGAGKTTQVRLLVDRLAARGIAAIATREPGGAPGAEDIRHLLVSGDTARWQPMTEALLHTAARVEHVKNLVQPTLATGTWVISDRYVDSTRAYQGSAQGVGAEAVLALHDLALGGLMPDLTLVLDLPVELGLARARSRAGGEDRYERMGAAFHIHLRDAFQAMAKAEPQRCVLVDAAGDVDVVAARLWSILASRFTL